MNAAEIEEIQKVYQQHPLREERILARVLSGGGTLTGLTELDLAEDPKSEVTDQNHIGGVQFVKELAAAAGVRPESQVLDLGCGLGGSARLLAHLHGCRVLGIDISRERCLEAESLTRRVGLQNLV